MSNIPAVWNLTLNVECPKCGNYFDLTDQDDFWVDAKFGAFEHGTEATVGLDVECPECAHEFECDFVY